MKRHDHDRAVAPADVLLVRRVLSGDRDARQELVERIVCVSRFLSSMNRRMGRPLEQEDLADLVQEVCLRVWQKLSTFEGRGSLESWIYRFCSLGILKHLEGRRRESERFDPTAAVDALVRSAGESADDPSGQFLASCLQVLSRQERRVVHLRYVEGLLLSEVARHLAIDLSSAKTYHQRALQKLRRFDVALERGCGR